MKRTLVAIGFAAFLAVTSFGSTVAFSQVRIRFNKPRLGNPFRGRIAGGFKIGGKLSGLKNSFTKAIRKIKKADILKMADIRKTAFRPSDHRKTTGVFRLISRDGKTKRKAFGRSVYIHTVHKRYLSVNNKRQIHNSPTRVRTKEAFVIVKLEADLIAFQAANGKFVTAYPRTHAYKVLADSNEIGYYQVFKLKPHGKEKLSFQSRHSRFLVALDKPHGWVIQGNRENIGPWEQFVFYDRK